MKMEVLSVQNQFQGQFGVLGSSKVKGENFLEETSFTTMDFMFKQVPTGRSTDMMLIGTGKSVMRGLRYWTSPLTPPPSSHHNNLTNNSNNTDDCDTITSATADNVTVSSTTTTNTITTTQVIAQDDASINALSLRLQSELRAAKSRHLACTEVLLPADLLHRVAAEIIKVSEKEPCGIRGCSVFIEFEDEPSNTRRIATLKVDPNTVSTFELYLTLKHDRSGWTSILPQFLKNLARSSTIMISPEFTLTKNKLYHTFSE